jgi:hypothetical protein
MPDHRLQEDTMSRSTLRARNVIIGAVSLAVLAVAPAAQAYPGDWSISGEFERTTTPSFAGGFNPNDVDKFSAAYDNRAKTLAIDLNYFQVPGRGNVYISFGTGLPDGSCNTGEIDVTIASRDITSTRTSWVWVPAQWYNSESRHYWRDGYWAIRTDTSVDAEHYERVATLERDGVDGSLEQVARLDSDQTEMGWTFGSPLLNGLATDCVEITVPGRRAPFVIAPPAAPVGDPAAPVGDPAAPISDPAPPTDSTPSPEATDEIALDDISTRATRIGSRIKLTMTGDADRLQLRIRKSSKTRAFVNRLSIKNQPTSLRYVYVRFSDGTDWSDWDRIAIKKR